MKLALRLYGDPVLRTKAVPVETVDDRIRALARAMIETMYAESGIGLAAQQVGETVSLCVVDVPPESDLDNAGTPLNPTVPMPMVLLNPRLERTSDTLERQEEGCLSFPDISAPVQRPAEIDLVYLGLDGQPHTIHLCGLTARAVQHEMDHLAGRLLVDHMTPVKKVALSGRLKRLRCSTQSALDHAPAPG